MHSGDSRESWDSGNCESPQNAYILCILGILGIIGILGILRIPRKLRFNAFWGFWGFWECLDPWDSENPNMSQTTEHAILKMRGMHSQNRILRKLWWQIRLFIVNNATQNY